MSEIQKRSCQPLETFVFGLRLQMWPLFQRAMSEQIEGLKKIAEGAGGGYFRRATTTSDVAITTVSLKRWHHPRDVRNYRASMADLSAICGSISLPRDSDRAERRNDDFLQVRRFESSSASRQTPN